ncbi:E3 ubiquitin-protein ligase SIRP1 (Salt-induced RING finger protein 1) (OsSIRP1) [Durusdinium trenchii]|uniref:E3 ubiquitin-protein ligase SIRP1 (Salt-induced RING finger protein 1) (OsSIRP1) n=1 Tax=Durusdinium trenchii TaxID=1381693 RepID=A0ABP0KMU5_9DINO
MNLVGPALVALGVSLLCAGGLLLQRYLDGSESDESNGSEYSFGFALNLKHVRKVLFRVDCQRAIEALPSVRLEQGEACAICLEPLEEARQLPCGHLFHQHCLLELTKSPSHSPSRRLRQEAHRAISCPLCRSVTVKIPVIGACREGAGACEADLEDPSGESQCPSAHRASL